MCNVQKMNVSLTTGWWKIISINVFIMSSVVIPQRLRNFWSSNDTKRKLCASMRDDGRNFCSTLMPRIKWTARRQPFFTHSNSSNSCCEGDPRDNRPTRNHPTPAPGHTEHFFYASNHISFCSEEFVSLSIVHFGPYLDCLWFVYRRLLIIFLWLSNFLISLFWFISGQGAACF